MKAIIVVTALIFSLHLGAQDLKMKGGNAGTFSLGARSSIGIVNDGKWQKTAFGAGGQFRLRFSDRVNSDWFLDYLTADLEDYAWRTDVHIGWSVMYYLLRNPAPVFQPYILAGHCFEYLKFTDNKDWNNHSVRYSASIQAGAGVSFNITKRFDISVVAQYMLHIGTKLTAAKVNDIAVFTKSSGVGTQDHILLHISLNYKIADLW